MKEEEGGQKTYPLYHIQLFSTSWTAVQTCSMILERAAKGGKGKEGEVRAHEEKERCSIPLGN